MAEEVEGKLNEMQFLKFRMGRKNYVLVHFFLSFSYGLQLVLNEIDGEKQ